MVSIGYRNKLALGIKCEMGEYLKSAKYNLPRE